MNTLIRYVIAIFTILVVGHSAFASQISLQDDLHLVATIKKIMNNDAVGAMNEAKKSQNSDFAKSVMDVLRIYNNPNSISLEKIDLFFAKYDWVPKDILLSKLERSITFEYDPRDIANWFAKYEPLSARGKLLMLHSNIAVGNLELDSPDTIKWLSDIWKTNDFDIDTETFIVGRYKDILTVDDLIYKIESLIWSNNIDFAKILIEFLPKHLKNQCNALISVAQNNDKASAQYHGHFKTHEFIQYVHARNLLKAKKEEEALQALIQTSATRNFHKWWKIKNAAIRDALLKKRYDIAIALSQNHRLQEGTPDFADAQWYSGWIALSYLNDYDAAIKNFHIMYEGTKLANSKSKAAYWLARSYEANGMIRKADIWYKEASIYTSTFYGQVAMTKHKVKDAQYYFDSYKEHNPTIKADKNKAAKIAMFAYHLFKAGYKNLAYNIISSIASLNLDRSDLENIAKFFNSRSLFPLSVELGKHIANKNFITIKNSYPHEVPVRKGLLDVWYYLGIIKQESNFDDAAESQRGAIGLMQLMPETAKAIAKKIGLPCNSYAKDSKYNIINGSAYFDELYAKYNSSILAIAAYNAGPGNVAKWLNTIGDPRRYHDLDAKINWIESIPFAETRNYIKKVIENIVVYHAIINKNANTNEILEIIS